MNDVVSDDGDPAPPHPHDFCAQLIRQLYGDLDRVLLDDSNAVSDDAFGLIAHAAKTAQARGAVLLVIARAALAAHREMIFGTAPPSDDLATVAAGEAVASLVPGARVQMPALQAQASRIVRTLGMAEQSNEPIHVPLARAIQRFYSALENEDAAVGTRALFELRSILVHLDACAGGLDQAGADVAPLRVIRPDRFHDYFMRYSELAQKPENQSGEAALATLTRDGRISAVITADSHPLEAAARSVRDMMSGDDTTRDHAFARIRALLEVLDQLRRQPQSLIGDALGDSNIHLSLVIAAATTPLQASGGFGLRALTQVARYNQMLLQGAGASVQ